MNLRIAARNLLTIVVFATGWVFLTAGACDTPYGVSGNPRSLAISPNTWAVAKQAGFKAVRTPWNWADLEPTQGDFAFDENVIGSDNFPNNQDIADDVVALATSLNLYHLVSIAQVPAWAGGGAGRNHLPSNYNLIANFATTMATRYCGQVDGYEFFSESNLPDNPSLLATKIQYRDFLQVFRDAIKAGCPGAFVIGPGNYCDGNIAACNGPEVTDRVTTNSGAYLVDGLAMHAYGHKNDILGRMTEMSTYITNHPSAPDFFFVTEFGVSTCSETSEGACTGSIVTDADNSNPVNVITAVFNKCKQLTGCTWAFQFTLHDQWNRNTPTDINCDYALIRGVADTAHNPAFTVGSLRQRLCGLQTYMGGSPPLTCTNENPDHQCHPD